MSKTNDFNKTLFSRGSVAFGDKPPTWTLSAVGDTSLWPNDTVGPALRLPEMFDAVRNHIGADLAYVNLEGPVTDREKKPSRFGLRGCWPHQLRMLEEVGFNLLCMANNHITDFGREGIADTLGLLRRHKLPHHGMGLSEAAARKPLIQTVGRTKVGFLAYCRDEAHLAIGPHCGAAPYDIRRVLADVRKLRKRVDVLVVSVHTGRIGTELPRREFRRRCRMLIDQGVDLILGAHPHQVHGIERHGKGLILYSLGNFFLDFGNSPPHENRGLIARIGFRGKRMVKLDIVPTQVTDDYAVVPMKDRERREFLHYLKGISDAIIDDARFDERNWQIATAQWDRVVERIYQFGEKGDRAGLDEYLASLHAHPINTTFFIGDYITEFLHRHIHGLPCGRGDAPHPDEE